MAEPVVLNWFLIYGFSCVGEARQAATGSTQAKRLIELHVTFERSSPLFVPFSNTRLDASWCSAHQAPLDETANHASVDKTQHADFHLVLSKFLKLTWKQLDWVD